MRLILAIFVVLFLMFTQVSYGQWATEYTGKRMHLSSAKLISQSKKNLKISVVISNTGRQDIRLYDGLNLETVVFTFGKSFTGELAAYEERILEKLVKQNNTLIRAGQLYTPRSFKVRKFTKEDTSSVKPDLISVTPDKSSKKLEQVEKKSIKKNTAKKGKSPRKKAYTMSPIGELPKPEASNECFDLVVDNVAITKSTKRNIYLSFELINYGQGTFRFDRKNKMYKNLSIKVFFASIPRLTRGSLIVGGNHFEDLFDDKQFNLGFGESIKGTMKISREKMTKFTPVVILELDPFSVVRECDKVNNVSTVLWKGN